MARHPAVYGHEHGPSGDETNHEPPEAMALLTIRVPLTTVEADTLETITKTTSPLVQWITQQMEAGAAMWSVRIERLEQDNAERRGR